MGLQINVKKSAFNAVYFPHLLDYSKRYEVYYGGGGSGKSHFVFQKIVLKALKSKRKVLVVRKVGRTHENSTWKLLRDTLSQFGIIKLCKINKTIRNVELPNGSEFIFVGVDDPEKIKSIVGITDIVCEECSELTLEDVSQLDIRLRSRQPHLQIFYMFNPVSKANWTYKKWFADEVEVNDQTKIIHTTYKDNRFLPQSYVDTLERMRVDNPTYYTIYALGRFATLDKLVYNRVNIVNDIETMFDKGACIDICGLDFGYSNDPTAFVHAFVDKTNKKIYVVDTWGEPGRTNPEIAQILKYKGYAKATIVADSAENKSIEELRRDGLRRIKGARKGAIMYGVQKLQQYDIYVSSACEDLITEFENYSWKKDRSTGEYINEPIDKYNHYLDALRYAMEIVETPKFTTLHKDALGL